MRKEINNTRLTPDRAKVRYPFILTVMQVRVMPALTGRRVFSGITGYVGYHFNSR